MKYILWTIGLVFVFAANAQLITKPIYRPTGKQKSTTSSNQRTAETDPLTLPFWDDFSTTTQDEPDSTKWASGTDIFVNASLGQNPPTYKVATFDGLQGDGTAYDFDDEYSTATDSLISQPIDLSQVGSSNQSTVYLSFFWQAGGFGEAPDESDSLVLYFSKNDTDTSLIWDRKWSTVGGVASNENFTQEILLVDSSAYFRDDFQFKFVAYTSQRGPFDNWHIDYIYLNQYRDAADTAHFDRAMTGATSAMLSPYTAIPAEIFFKNPEQYFSDQTIQVSCLDDQPHPLEYYYSLQNLTTGEAYGSSGSTEEALLQGHEIRTVAIPDIDAISITAQDSPLDSQVVRSTFYYKTGDKHLFEQVVDGDTIFLDQDLKVNDTITTDLLLHNYYAYDDGVAEYAAGVNELYGQVAVMFVLDEPDTLTHIDIYFPSIAPDPEDVGIDLLVWNYLDDLGIFTRQAYTISAPDGRDAFTRIELSEPAFIEDTVYIGYEQDVDDYLGVGLDKSNSAASDRIFYNVTGEWKQNDDDVSGALMIRAVFGESDYVLSAESVPSELKIYPNPTSGSLTIDSSYDQLIVFDMLGRRVFESERQDSYDLSFLKDGIYLAKIINGQTVETRKIVIQK